MNNINTLQYNFKFMDIKLKLKHLLLMLFLLNMGILNAQQKIKVTGQIVDNNQEAIIGANVLIKGTTIGREQIKLAGSNKSYSVAKVLHKSEKEDFIVFMVNCQNTNYIPIAKSKPRIGDKVYAIGSPRGLENTFSSGEVSQWRADNLMQISALIDHGSSGGALINEYGEVVGITSGSFADGSQANLNYAWSIDVVKPYIK